MPRWQMASGVRPAISWPLKRIDPVVGARAPETQLKQVVLPDPLGPMSPRISPSLTSKETALSAVKPPKRLVRRSTESTRRAGEAGERAPASSGMKSASGPGRRRGQHDGRVARGDDLRPHVSELPVDHLVHRGDGALVLAAHRIALAEELHAVALHRSALGN